MVCNVYFYLTMERERGGGEVGGGDGNSKIFCGRDVQLEYWRRPAHLIGKLKGIPIP